MVVPGGTLDDALGESFDKAARLLGLCAQGSGGAAVEAQARHYYSRLYREENERYANSSGIGNGDVLGNCSSGHDSTTLKSRSFISDAVEIAVMRRAQKELSALDMKVPMR